MGLAAFGYAATCGYDGVELDVQLSRDGEVVVFHDYRLKPELCRSAEGRWLESPAPRIKDNCNGCAICVTACVYGAMTMSDGRAVIDDARCTRCGLCVTRCRLDAVAWDVNTIPVAHPSA